MWTNAKLIYWRIYAALGGDELKYTTPLFEINIAVYEDAIILQLSVCGI